MIISMLTTRSRRGWMTMLILGMNGSILSRVPGDGERPVAPQASRALVAHCRHHRLQRTAVHPPTERARPAQCFPSFNR